MNPYDILARGLFQLLGLSPEDIKRQQAENYRQKANQKPIKVKGQTRTTGKGLDPVQTRSTQQTTPPRRPAGGFGQASGQLSIPEVTGGNNPNARPSGSYQAPRVGIPVQGAAGPDIPERPNPYRATGSTRPGTGFTKAQTTKPASKLTIGGLTNLLTGGIFGQGAQIADMLLNLNNTSLVEETFGTGRVYQDFQKSLNRQNPSSTPYTGMQDMSGDPILPQPKGGKGGKPQSGRSGGNSQGGRSGSRPQQIPVDNFDYGPNPYDLNGQPQAIPAAPTLPSAPPEYGGMSEMERLKIWAITHRQMIESVGTRRQKNILNQALGMAKNNLKSDSSQVRAMSRM